MDNRKQQPLFVCPKCGAKFSPDATGGVCPYCRTADSALIHSQQRQYRKKQARQKQLKKAAVRLGAALVVLILIIVGAVNLISGILKGNETVLYAFEKGTSSPVFYTDSDGKAFFVAKNNTPILIGKGEITAFCSSEKNKITYFVFEGSRDLDALNTSGSQLLAVGDDGTIRSVAEYPYGKITMAQGGNCDYIYYLINETLSSYQSSSRLYLYRTGDKAPKKIADFSQAGDFDTFRVSPNGHYLLYKAQDDGGTKLMRYSVKSDLSESLGIKNAEPISIDNKGTYYSYLKLNEQQTFDFYVESSVSDREKTTLPTNEADRILLSADCRSFVIETGNLTVIKAIGSEPVSVAARTGSAVGIQKISALTEQTAFAENVHEIAFTENTSFYPYLYFGYEADGTRTLMSCEKDGTKHSLTDKPFTDFVANNTSAAFIAENSLYTVSFSSGGPAVLVSENFGEYTLRFLSDNGKYIFYGDSDGNVFRIPFDYTGRDWIKAAVDADPLVLSPDGRNEVYFSDNALYYGKDDQSFKVAQGVLPDNTYVLDGTARLLYLAESEASKAQNALSLYSYDGKKSVLIADNVLSVQGYPTRKASYIDTPYSSYNGQNDLTDLSDTTDSAGN